MNYIAIIAIVIILYLLTKQTEPFDFIYPDCYEDCKGNYVCYHYGYQPKHEYPRIYHNRPTYGLSLEDFYEPINHNPYDDNELYARYP